MRYCITDADWIKILHLLRQERRIHLQDTGKLRKFLEAIWYVTRTGCQWRLLPAEYGGWRAVHKRWFQWAKKGVWTRVLSGVTQGQEASMAVMMDATTVRAHACAAGYGRNSQAQMALGKSAGGFSTKIHALVNHKGIPLKFSLTPGQTHERTQADELVKGLKRKVVLADRGYDCDALIKSLEEQGCAVVIPPRCNRKYKRPYAQDLYRQRNLIERFFGKLKQFRRVFSRFDKTTVSFLSFLAFASCLIALR